MITRMKVSRTGLMFASISCLVQAWVTPISAKSVSNGSILSQYADSQNEASDAARAKARWSLRQANFGGNFSTLESWLQGEGKLTDFSLVQASELLVKMINEKVIARSTFEQFSKNFPSARSEMAIGLGVTKVELSRLIASERLEARSALNAMFAIVNSRHGDSYSRAREDRNL